MNKEKRTPRYINWPDWMKDGTIIAKDGNGVVHIYADCFQPLHVDIDHRDWVGGYSYQLQDIQAILHLPENFITPEYLALDWKESKIVKGEG